MESLWQDLRYGARMLRKQPGFALIAVFTLALGIGANSAIFSVVNAVLLTPLPYRDPGRLVMLWERNPATGMQQEMVTPPDLADWQAAQHVFENMTYWTGDFDFNLVTANGGALRAVNELVHAPRQLRAAAGGLRYEETGRLRFGDYQGQARRGAHYDFVAPDKANVTFEDGGLFHDLVLTKGLWRVLHPCGPDLYRGRIQARSADCWQVAWRVSGPPRKLTNSFGSSRSPTSLGRPPRR